MLIKCNSIKSKFPQNVYIVNTCSNSTYQNDVVIVILFLISISSISHFEQINVCLVQINTHNVFGRSDMK